MSKINKEDQTVIAINPKSIVEREGFNTRINFGDMGFLKASIKTNGFKPEGAIPVTKDLATDGKYLLNAQGHRRLKAALELQEEKELPGNIVYVIVEEAVEPSEMNLQILTLNTGKPLELIEEAHVIKRAFEFEPTMSKRDLGRRIGKSDTHITNCLMLLDQSKKVQAAVEKGKIAASYVLEIAKQEKNNPEAVEKKVITAVEAATESGGKKATKKTGKKKTGKKKGDAVEAGPLEKVLMFTDDLILECRDDKTLSKETKDKVREIVKKIREIAK